MRSKNKIKDLDWCELELIWETDKKGKIKHITMHFNDHLKIKHVKIRFPQQGIYKINISEEQSRYQFDDSGKRIDYEESQLDTWLNFFKSMEGFREREEPVEILLTYLLSMELGNVIASFQDFFSAFVKDFDLMVDL